MNIQQFLEQRGEIELDDGSYLDLQQHNAILINFILGEVEREVKEYVKGLDSLPWDEQVDEDVSKMLNNLRVK